MSGAELQPLSLGELLDRAFTLYRRNFWLFVGIMALPLCLYIPAQFLLLRTRRVPFPWSKVPPNTEATLVTFGTLLVFWIIYSIAQGAATYAVADAYLGRSSTVRGAYIRIRGRFWRMMALILNVGFRVFGLMLLLIFAGAIAGGALAYVLGPGNKNASLLIGFLVVGFIGLGVALALWFSLRYAISMPALLLEDIKGRAAIRRSVQLSKGRRSQLFVAVLLTVVLSYTATIVFQGPFYLTIALMGIKGQLPAWLALAMSVSGVLGGALTGPLLMIVLVLCYYDLRIRKEGFDLEFMMASLPDTKPAGSASPA